MKYHGNNGSKKIQVGVFDRANGKLFFGALLNMTEKYRIHGKVDAVFP